MNNDTQFEKISALADGALDQNEMDALLKQLYSGSGRQAWDTYHLVGDALRSDDLATPLSADFDARFAARFASEPVLMAPPAGQPAKTGNQNGGWRKYVSLYSMGGGAVAALLAVMLLPQIHNSRPETALQAWNRNAPAQTGTPLRLASVNDDSTVASNPAVAEHADTAGDKARPAEVLRNPDLDSYLIAHQRFSPAIGANAQYLNRANLPVNNPEK